MNTRYKNFKARNIFIGAEHGQQSSMFSPDRTTAFDGHELDNMLQDCVFEDLWLDRALNLLSEKRIVVLHGPGEAGMTTAALKLVAMLGIGSATPCRLVQPLPGNIKVNPIGIGEDDGKYHGSAFIFRHALSRQNQDVLDFLKMDEYQLEQEYTPRLASRDGYLVFTGETDRFSPVREALESVGLMAPMTAPGRDLFERSLRIQLKRYKQANSENGTRAMALLEKGSQESLFEKLKSLSRLNRFLKQNLDAFCTGELDLDLALGQFDDLHHWFFNELTADFGVWSHGVALALLSFGKEDRGEAWLDYLGFHRWLLPILRKNFPSAQRVSPIGFLPSDHQLCQKLQAEIRVDEISMVHRIRFLGGGVFANELWRHLLKNGKRLFSPLLPVLKEKVDAEAKREEADQYYTGALYGELSLPLAAKILGRLGEIQPNEVARPLLSTWVETVNFSYWEALGYFMTGVYLGGNRNYLETCWRILESLEPDSGSWKDAQDPSRLSEKDKDPAGKDSKPGSDNHTEQEREKPEHKGHENKPDPSAGETQGQKAKAVNAVNDTVVKDETAPVSQDKDREVRECRRAALCACYFFLIEQDPERAFKHITGLVKGWLFHCGIDWDADLKNLKERQERIPTLEMVHSPLREEFGFPELFVQLMYEYGLQLGVLTLLDGLRKHLAKIEHEHYAEARKYQPLDWLVLLFLLPKGLFEQWTTRMPDPRPARFGAELPPKRPFNLLVSSIAANERAVRRLAAFLNMVFENIGEMRVGGYRGQLKQTLQDHLVNWSVFAMGNPEHREAMEELFRQLLNGACDPFKKAVRLLLAHHPYFADKRTNLHQMATRVLGNATVAAG